MHPVSNTLATEWQNSSPITILFMQNIKATTPQCTITTGIVRDNCLGKVILQMSLCTVVVRAVLL